MLYWLADRLMHGGCVAVWTGGWDRKHARFWPDSREADEYRWFSLRLVKLFEYFGAVRAFPAHCARSTTCYRATRDIPTMRPGRVYDPWTRRAS